MDDPASRGTPVRDRLLSRALQRTILRGMSEHPELAVSAGGPPEVRLVGLDPIRVLVIGSGLAVGYGVRTHEEALTGALARAVQAGTSRGVIVQNHATRLTGLEHTVESIGLVGAATFHLVVWCPSLFDVFRSPERGRSNRALMEGLRLLRETARPDAELVLCALPAPIRRGPSEEIARTFVARFNPALRRAVAALPGVRVAETPDMTTLADPQAFSADYYDRWAEQIVHPEALARTGS